MSELNNYINNEILKKKSSYTLILGLTPSQGARSPKLWNKVYKKTNSQCRMYPADVSNKNLKNLIRFLKIDKKFKGGSITAPYKEEIMKYLDIIDLDAKKIGSVNTIVKKKNKLVGFNTDYFGALTTIKKINCKKNILIFGAGGASKAVILALCKRFKRSNYFFYNRNSKKFNFLKKFPYIKKIKILKNLSQISIIKDIDLIVNTSSVGFDSWIKKNNGSFNLKFFSPLTKIKNLTLNKNKDLRSFRKKNLKLILEDTNNLKVFFQKNNKIDIFDIIYQPKNTRLLKFAKINGNKIYNGLEMNLIQAVKGFMLVNKLNNFNNIKNKML
tara:strand:+ start:1125 stop:2108 length:984 start_codon:yes stop_codon:yes gene_type:complete